MHGAPVLDLHPVHNGGLDFHLRPETRDLLLRRADEGFGFGLARDLLTVLVADAHAADGQPRLAWLEDLLLVEQHVGRGDEFAFERDGFLGQHNRFADAHHAHLPVGWERLVLRREAVVKSEQRNPRFGQGRPNRPRRGVDAQDLSTHADDVLARGRKRDGQRA